MSGNTIFKLLSYSLLLAVILVTGLPTEASRNGTQLYPGDFPFVVKVRAPVGNGRSGIGSGVLLAPDIVLTAKHVVGIFKAQQITVYSQSVSPQSSSENRRALEREARGLDLRVLSEDGREEFVLIKLDKPLPFSSTELRVRTSPVTPGETVYGVGYGITATTDIQIKRMAQMKFDNYVHSPPYVGKRIPIGFLEPGPDLIRIAEIVPSVEFGSQLLCSGDSGGGVFTKSDRGIWELIGLVNSVHLGWDSSDEEFASLINNKQKLCEKGVLNRVLDIRRKMTQIQQVTDELKTTTIPLADGTPLLIGQSLPDQTKLKVQNTLNWALSINLEKSSIQFRWLFGKIHTGKQLVSYVLKNNGQMDPANYIGADMDQNTGTLAFAKRGTIYISGQNIELLESLSKVDFFSILLHEAYHKNQLYPSIHVACPTPFLEQNGEERRSHISDELLSGRRACDISVESAYSAQYLFLKNLGLYCSTCIPEEKDNALRSADEILKRIIDEDTRAKLLNDL